MRMLGGDSTGEANVEADVGCPRSCWQSVQEQGHLLLLGSLRCPRPEKVSQVLHCGPALSGPVLPGYRLPKVCDLPAVKQGLPHDLLEGHVLRADQPVGMQLPERLQVRQNPPWSLDSLARGAGAGYGSDCAQALLCYDSTTADSGTNLAMTGRIAYAQPASSQTALSPYGTARIIALPCT